MAAFVQKYLIFIKILTSKIICQLNICCNIAPETGFKLKQPVHFFACFFQKRSQTYPYFFFNI